MSSRIGLELTYDRIRAVSVARWGRKPNQTFEIRWDPRAPRDAVALLRQHLGEANAVCIAVGLAFLHAKNVQLPPVSSHERRGILTLEPDRFFAIESSAIVVATRHDSDLVFAADAGLIESWISVFEEWAPVAVVEPAPSSAARGLKIAGVRSGSFQISSSTDEHGIVELANGRVVSARRTDEASSSPKALALPSARGVRGEFLVAYGAANGAEASLDEMLLPAGELKRARSRRRASVAKAGANFSLALVFAIAAFDRSLTRVLEKAQQEIQSLAPRVAGPSAVQSRLAQLDAESSAARTAGTAHSDPVAVLAAISRRLPHDAIVMSVRADGDEWQIDGTARNAANIVPALDADPAFENVRSLSASSRFNEGNKTYETFSVALHAHR